MRKTILALAAICCITGCHNANQEQIRTSAQAYLEAMANYSISGAAPYATKETKETTLYFYSYLLTFTDTAYISANTPATITINGIEQTSDSTAQVVYSKKAPLSQQSGTLKMKLENGKWLADDVVAVPSWANAEAEQPQQRIPRETLQNLTPHTTDQATLDLSR